MKLKFLISFKSLLFEIPAVKIALANCNIPHLSSSYLDKKKNSRMNAISKRKKVHLILLVLALAATACMELGFRAYLFKHYGHDSILAGSIPNFIAVVLITLIYTVIKGENESSLKMSSMGCCIMVLYELAQPLIAGRTFDVFDIVASLMGGLFVFCLLTIVDHYFKSSPLKP